MMDYVSTPARAKGVAPLASHEEGYTEAATARPPKASPLPTADGVDKIYCQLAEIDAIAVVQLAECIRWHRSNLTLTWLPPAPGWRGPTVEPSVARTAPLPSVDFSPRASLRQRGPHVEPQAHRWVGAQHDRRARNLHHS
jgi:hypothetical protein